MKTKLITFIFSLFSLISCAQQEKSDADKILAICKANAKVFLSEKVNADFGDSKDVTRINLKLATMAANDANISLVNRSVIESIERGEISKNNPKQVIDLVFNEYRKYVTDLPQAFYDKSLADLNN